MFEELQTICLSGQEYPIKCDLLVLEKIQEKYPSIDEFEQELITWEPEVDENGEEILGENGKPKIKGKFPEAKAVIDALYWMACEGEEIAAEKEKRAPKIPERKALIRQVDITIVEVARPLYLEFCRCFNSKNGKATQNPKKK
ncbi:MAG TPA: hypothetical protein IAA44_02560 [Candidatus Blautia avistercoris]|mgnify:CR=1 FL=1|nr:hypothetical protein [Candidatus Blautia avistercoris]